MRRCGIKIGGATTGENIVLKIQDINEALSSSGFQPFHGPSIPGTDDLISTEQVNLEEFVKSNYEKEGVGREEEWKMVMEWLAVDGVKTENTAVGGGRKRKNGEEG